MQNLRVEAVRETSVIASCVGLKHALVEDQGGLVVVYVAFNTKYFRVGTEGYGLDEEPQVQVVSDKGGLSEISFPNRKGWEIVSSSTSKYNLTVVLRKPRQVKKYFWWAMPFTTWK